MSDPRIPAEDRPGPTATAPARETPPDGLGTRYLNAVQAASYLRVSVSWLRKATRRTEVPSFQIGSRVLYDREDLDAYVHTLKQEAAWARADRRHRRRA